MHIIIDPDHVEMVFPDAVDLKVIFREAFIDKMVVFKDFERRYIFRHDISFNTMEMKLVEGIPHYHIDSHRHISLIEKAFI